MSRFSLRRMAAVGVSAALLGTGVTVGLGTGVASAYDASTCQKSAEREFSNAGTGAAKYYVTKAVEGDGTVGANGTVSFLITVRASQLGVNIKEIRDFGPEGFELKKVELDANYILGGQKWTDESDRAVQSGDKVVLGGGGWTTAGGAVVALRVTYEVPSTIKVGDKIDAGGAGFTVQGTANGVANFPDMNLCLTGRMQNPVEAIYGSLGSMGLGSIADLGGEFTGSFTNPSSPLLGSVGSVAGSASGS